MLRCLDLLTRSREIVREGKKDGTRGMTAGRETDQVERTPRVDGEARRSAAGLARPAGRIPAMGRLTRERIEEAFDALNGELSRRGAKAEVFVVGGAVLDVVLAFYPPERLPVRTRLLLEEMLDGRP